VIHRERDWFIPVAIILAVEAAAWCALWVTGRAEFPLSLAFEFLAHAAIMPSLAWRLGAALRRNGLIEVRRRLSASFLRIAALIAGLQLFVFGAALFGALKAALPATVPFWLDQPLARAEHDVFGMDPWQISQAALGWATPAIDLIYATFLPGHLIAVFVILTAAPSAQKTRAMISLFLIWLMVGVGAAYALSSVGPLFYDRAFGSDLFNGLDQMVARSAAMTRATGDLLWQFHASGVANVANGISAMPSMHVGLTLWLALLLCRTRFGPLAWLYYGLIWFGSVHLGWHYVSDGLVASLGVLALWWAVGRLQRALANARSSAPAS
jgi:hypothetical protein